MIYGKAQHNMLAVRIAVVIAEWEGRKHTHSDVALADYILQHEPMLPMTAEQQAAFLKQKLEV